MLTGNPFLPPTDMAGKGGNAADVFAGQMRMTVATGAAQDTNIAVAGIKPEDKIWKVLEFATAAAIATLTDRTTNVSVIADGQIQLNTDTANDALLVFWFDRNP